MNTATATPLRGELSIPGDKSISHRAIMFGSLANGLTEVTNFLQGADCLSTIDCFRNLGVTVENTPGHILIRGNGIHGLKAPAKRLDVGNSGTTIRLISGILSAQRFDTEITGDDSIERRPMKRIITPLSQMNASITSLPENDCAPLLIRGNALKGIHYHSPIASAQVKSAILLAGLYADGKTSITEPYISRNHSEIMLRHFGADITMEHTTASIEPEPYLMGQKIIVPGDISSAAYFIAAGLLIPGSEIILKNVGINPTRDGILKVARMMGGKVTLSAANTDSGEPVADILIQASALHGITIEGGIIPTLIDEIPIIAVMAACAEGRTVIRDAAELKVKESNRIDVMAANLTAMGAVVTPTDDGMIIDGGTPLTGAVVDSHSDHRIAMSFAIAALLAKGETTILGSKCVAVSYPEFYRDLNALQQ